MSDMKDKPTPNQLGTVESALLKSESLKSASLESESVMASLLMASSLFLGVGVAVTSDNALADEQAAETRDNTAEQEEQASDPLSGATIDAALVYYQEQDRVTAAEGIINYRQALDDANIIRDRKSVV